MRRETQRTLHICYMLQKADILTSRASSSGCELLLEHLPEQRVGVVQNGKKSMILHGVDSVPPIEISGGF